MTKTCPIGQRNRSPIRTADICGTSIGTRWPPVVGGVVPTGAIRSI
jgi:hypothetical protein